MSFWEKGYDALFISSFYKNPHEHSASDTLDRVNQKFLVKAAGILIGMIIAVANE
jgi:hypothetical protein